MNKFKFHKNNKLLIVRRWCRGSVIIHMILIKIKYFIMVKNDIIKSEFIKMGSSPGRRIY